jgi:hypothetical protein
MPGILDAVMCRVTQYSASSCCDYPQPVCDLGSGLTDQLRIVQEQELMVRGYIMLASSVSLHLSLCNVGIFCPANNYLNIYIKTDFIVSAKDQLPSPCANMLVFTMQCVRNLHFPLNVFRKCMMHTSGKFSSMSKTVCNKSAIAV